MFLLLFLLWKITKFYSKDKQKLRKIYDDFAFMSIHNDIHTFYKNKTCALHHIYIISSVHKLETYGNYIKWTSGITLFDPQLKACHPS